MDLLAELLDWWGLSLPLTLLLLALILIIADVVIQSDVATHVAYILVAVTVAYCTPVQILFRLIVGMLAWGALVGFHFALWRSVMTHLVNRLVAPTKYKSGVAGVLGLTGTIKLVDDKKMVSVQGDLWDYEGSRELPAGAKVKVVGENEGMLRVEFLKEDG